MNCQLDDPCTRVADCSDNGTPGGLKGSCYCDCEEGWDGDKCNEKEDLSMEMMAETSEQMLILMEMLAVIWTLVSLCGNPLEWYCFAQLLDSTGLGTWCPKDEGEDESSSEEESSSEYEVTEDE